MDEQLAEAVFRTALSMLSTGGLTTQADVELAAEAAVGFLARDRAAEVDQEQLIRRLQAALDIYQPESLELTDDTGHVPWLEGRRNTIDWSFSERYLRYLRERENRPPRVLDRLDQTTLKTLSRLGDPERKHEPWDRRGLVVGGVQSGKTGNFIGLVCRAADAGYRLVVVLAGMHNNLRSQTQLRLDEGFLGFDTQIRQDLDRNGSAGSLPDGVLGVGRLPGAQQLAAASLTTSADRGDFTATRAKSVPVQLGTLPVVLVVKKHAGILDKLTAWVLETAGQGEPRLVHGFPLLVLDDEADNASISTRDPYIDNQWAPEDVDPTRVNAAIRSLLNAFQRKAYVGYTATPNANIYIPHDVDHPKFGKDLFPQHFIEYIRPPSNYFGPTRVFGTQDTDDDEPDTDTAPRGLIRVVKDHTSWLPDKHKNGTTPGALPKSLREALRSFVLARAVRLARGQRRKHNSMLVHVSRFQNVQEAVRDQIRDELEDLRGRIRFGDGDGADIRDELKKQFERDFSKTTAEWPTAEPVEPVSWEAVERELAEAADPIEFRLINGDAGDALEYFEHRNEGLNVIAVGGNKLSRGLTLEGLTVSYYLRAAATHDTLLQMGRWFGYRDGYEDVCRLYTTAPLLEAFRGVTDANQELIDEFETMAQQGKTPREYGLKIQNTVPGMLVTARNKMPGATTVRIGFSGQGPSTVVLYCDKERAELNLKVTDNLVRDLDTGGYGADVREGDTRVWSGVDAEMVATEFFDRYQSPSTAWRVQGGAIAAYIRNRVAEGELTDWTVALLSSTDADAMRGRVGDRPVGLTRRAVLSGLEGRLADGLYSIKQLLSPGHEALDLSDAEREQALQLTLQYYRENSGRWTSEPKIPVGRAIRAIRPRSRGLLLLYPLRPPAIADDAVAANNDLTSKPIIGFLASFPRSPGAPGVDYVVNRVYWEEFFGDEDLDEEPS